MKLFQGIFGKTGGVKLLAPVPGKLVSIKDVSDPTFGEEILGKGVAVIPSDGKICAPADGTVTTVFPTGHAVVITGDKGEEILIHAGLDTVNLKGQHFTIHASENQQVKAGDLLLEADFEKIAAEGYDIITPVVICNPDAFSKIQPENPGEIARGDVIMTLEQ